MDTEISDAKTNRSMQVYADHGLDHDTPEFCFLTSVVVEREGTVRNEEGEPSPALQETQRRGTRDHREPRPAHVIADVMDVEAEVLLVFAAMRPPAPGRKQKHCKREKRHARRESAHVVLVAQAPWGGPGAGRLPRRSNHSMQGAAHKESMVYTAQTP